MYQCKNAAVLGHHSTARHGASARFFFGGSVAVAATRLRQPLNGRPTSIRIAALDDLPVVMRTTVSDADDPRRRQESPLSLLVICCQPRGFAGLRICRPAPKLMLRGAAEGAHNGQ
jgi:hypothetical protein